MPGAIEAEEAIAKALERTVESKGEKVAAKAAGTELTAIPRVLRPLARLNSMLGSISTVLFMVPMLGGLIGGAARMKASDPENLKGVRGGASKVSSFMQLPNSKISDLGDNVSKVTGNRHAAAAAKKAGDAIAEHAPRLANKSYGDLAWAGAIGVGATYGLAHGVSSKVNTLRRMQVDLEGEPASFTGMLRGKKGLHPIVRHVRREGLVGVTGLAAMGLDLGGVGISLYKMFGKNIPPIMNNKFVDIGLVLGPSQASAMLSGLNPTLKSFAEAYNCIDNNIPIPKELYEAMIGGAVGKNVSETKVFELAESCFKEGKRPADVLKLIDEKFYSKNPSPTLQDASATKGLSKSSLALSA